MCAKFRFSISSRCDDIIAEVKGGNFMPAPSDPGLHMNSAFRFGRASIQICATCRLGSWEYFVGWYECVCDAAQLTIVNVLKIRHRQRYSKSVCPVERIPPVMWRCAVAVLVCQSRCCRCCSEDLVSPRWLPWSAAPSSSASSTTQAVAWTRTSGRWTTRSGWTSSSGTSRTRGPPNRRWNGDMTVRFATVELMNTLEHIASK